MRKLLASAFVLPNQKAPTDAPASILRVDPAEKKSAQKCFGIRWHDDEPPRDGPAVVIDAEHSVSLGVNPRVLKLVAHLFERLTPGGVVTGADALSKFG